MDDILQVNIGAMYFYVFSGFFKTYSDLIAVISITRIMQIIAL